MDLSLDLSQKAVRISVRKLFDCRGSLSEGCTLDLSQKAVWISARRLHVGSQSENCSNLSQKAVRLPRGWQSAGRLDLSQKAFRLPSWISVRRLFDSRGIQLLLLYQPQTLLTSHQVNSYAPFARGKKHAGSTWVQGYLAQNTPPPPGSPEGPKHSPTVGSYGGGSFL